MWDRLSTGQKVVLGVALPGTAVLAYLLWKGGQDSDDVSSDALVTSRQTVITVTIPHHAVGGVIGRQGCNIKEIQTISGARVNFNDRNLAKDDTSDRVVTIRGSSQAAQKAHLMISKIISELPVKTSLEITVPQSIVGRIIGKGGDSIKEIRQISKARINIGHANRDVAFVPVILEGSEQEIELAKGMIEDIVAEAAEGRRRTADVVAQRPERRKARPVNDSNGEVLKSDSPINPSLQSPSTATWPKNPDAYIEIFVSAVEHPHHFWCQILSGSASQLDELTRLMTEFYGHSEKTEMTLTPDDLVAAPFEWDQAWYRARVLQVLDDEVDLYYVDFGDSCVVPKEQVRPLRSDYLRLAFQAVECRLSGVEPANNQDWTDAACAKFEDLTYCAKWRVIMARAQSYIQTDNGVIPCLILVDTHGSEDVDIAQALIGDGHASLPPSPSSPSPPSTPDKTSRGADSANEMKMARLDRYAVKQVLDLGKLEAE